MVYSILHILQLSRKMLPFWPGSMVVNDYATRKKITTVSHAVEYGLIFHGTRIGKYYCKNMKYRINIFTRNVLLSAQMGERTSVVLICIITSRYNEVK